MSKLTLTMILIVLVIASLTLAVFHYPSAQVAVQNAVSPGELSAKHAYLANRCESCHQSAVGVTAVNCTVCHATSALLLGRQPTEFHASVGECAGCHVEHQGTGIRPLTMDHVALARIGARTLERASRTDADSAATWASLETWLAIKHPDQLQNRSARSALDCASCHDRRDPHFKYFGSDCAQCHSFETWKVPGYQHPSSRSTECVQCHKAPPSHFMGHFSMVSQKMAGKPKGRVEQCYACHNTTSWNDIVGVGFYKHH